MSEHPELFAEQRYLDHAYERLAEMREAAKSAMEDVLDLGRGGTFQSRTERDVVVRNSLARLDQLDIGEQPLCFGRTDATSGETYYIGRMGVSGRSQEPLIIDWRARVAEPFYRATGCHPMGLVRRRHFEVRSRQIVGIEDEPIHVDSTDDITITGQGALLAALERSRSGQMSDIVATIQREQDEAIRAPLAGKLVVQGGPGTGKTAVALHRAAYLLYTHRFPLEHLGVLVIGPNPVFLRYISHVLPSLGETGVTLSTISGLVHDTDIRAIESQELAAIKGDIRMVKFLRKAVRSRQRALRDDLIIGFGAMHLRIKAAETKAIVDSVKRRGGAHNPRRKSIERALIDVLYERFERGTRRGAVRSVVARTVGYEEFAEAIAADADFVTALDRMWPRLHATELLHDLYGAMPLLKLAGKGVLRDKEIVMLYRTRSFHIDDIPWTEADIALLDEAKTLLGPARSLAEGEVFLRTYGHVVSDETQDLSPMQLRMLGRRSLNGSMTLVGDIAQATGSWEPKNWNELLQHVGGRGSVTHTELTIGYRTPEEVMSLANRVLDKLELDVAAPRPVRSSGNEPVRVVSEDVWSEVAQLVAELAEDDGTLGVIAANPSEAATCFANGEREVQLVTDALHTGIERKVMVVTPELAKGLEFDSVIVVEPSRVVVEHGMRSLYVALTRTTNRLFLVEQHDSHNEMNFLCQKEIL